MSVDNIVKEYEDDLNVMMYNKYSKELVTTHFYAYRSHLDQYHLLSKPLPDNRFKELKQRFMEYVKK